MKAGLLLLLHLILVKADSIADVGSIPSQGQHLFRCRSNPVSKDFNKVKQPQTDGNERCQERLEIERLLRTPSPSPVFFRESSPPEGLFKRRRNRPNK